MSNGSKTAEGKFGEESAARQKLLVEASSQILNAVIHIDRQTDKCTDAELRKKLTAISRIIGGAYAELDSILFDEGFIFGSQKSHFDT